MSAPNPYSWGVWPMSPIEAQVRAERDSAEAKIAAVVQLVLAAEDTHGGLVTACDLRAAVGMGKRVRG